MRRALCVAVILLGSISAAWAETTSPAGTNIVITGSGDKRVSLDVQNARLEDVMRALSKQYGLSIICAKNVDTTVSARFNDVTLDEALQSLVTINGFAYRRKGDVIEVYLPAAGGGVAVERPTAQTFRLKYANAVRLRDVLKPFISTEGRIEADVNNNVLMVCDYPNVLANLDKMIQQVDKAEPQIVITAEIIETAIDDTNKLGVQWQTAITANGAARPITFPFDANSTGGSFVPANKPASGTSDDEFGDGQAFPYPTTDNFTFGTIDATGLKATLNMLRSDTKTTLIANPEITTLSNHEAKINIGDTVPVPIYTTNLETGVTAVTGFQQIDTGTILAVIPQVNDGGDSVTMLVKPEISEILGYKGQFDERPIVSSRRAETTVRLKDGETLVIGGLVRVKDTDTITKVPVLGDIPLLGWAFKSKTKTKQKSTLYIFITPRIVTPEVGQNLTKKAGERLVKEGLKEKMAADDVRNPGTTPFKTEEARPGSR